MKKTPDEAFEISTWNRNFETGIPIVDRQHKQLVRILNQLAAHLGNQADAMQLNEVFAELTAYADYHFRTEEEIWQPYFKDDPWFAEHHRVHESFLGKLSELMEEEKTQPKDQVVEDILRFLTHWLAHHILDSDKNMARVIQGIDAGLSLEQAKRHAEQEMSGSMIEMLEAVMSMHDNLSSRTFDLMRERSANRKMAQALEASERREKAFSDTIMRSMPGLLYLFDDQLQLVRWNAQLSERTGYPPEELAHMHLLDFFEQRYHSEVRDFIASIHDGGYAEMEGTMLAKGGDLLPFQFTCVPLVIEGAQYFVGVGVDISRRRMAESRLRMLSSSVEQANESIIIADGHGAIKYVNPAFLRLTGYTEEEVIGQNPRILNSGKQDRQFYEEMWKSISSGHAWQGRVVDKRKDGSLYPAMLTISPIREKSGKIESYVGIQQDLSAYESLEMQFHQAQKMEAIGTLVGGIAHDFNNVLAGIISNLYLAQQRVSDRPEVLQRLSGIERLSFRAADMIQQLLTFARKDQVSMKPFTLTAFVKETAKFMRSSIPENIDMQLDICNEALNISGDSTQLHQVLLNLVNNARDAVESSDNPCVCIGLQPFHTDEDFCRAHPNIRPGDYAHLSVSDNGSGISEEDLAHVFEPFFTTKELGRGTGLGLAMVFGAIESHRGHCIVESSPGKGSCFHVYLPLQKPDSGEQATGTRERQVKEGHGEQILFVDDEAEVLASGRDLLHGLGYRVLCAHDGEEAVAIFREHGKAIDLILSDVVMPRLSGVKALEAIRRIDPHARAIFATGYDRNASLPQDLPANCVVLTKPYDVVSLSRSIREQLDRPRD